MAERTAISPDRGQEPAYAELARIHAGAADPASDEKRLPADVARKVFKRRFLDRVADRIDEPERPDGLRPPKTMNAPLAMRTIAGVGKVASRSAVTFSTRRALSPTSLAARMRSPSLASWAPSASSRASCTGSAPIR